MGKHSISTRNRNKRSQRLRKARRELLDVFNNRYVIGVDLSNDRSISVINVYSPSETSYGLCLFSGEIASLVIKNAHFELDGYCDKDGQFVFEGVSICHQRIPTIDH
jgi:hypothetical protein